MKMKKLMPRHRYRHCTPDSKLWCKWWCAWLTTTKRHAFVDGVSTPYLERTQAFCNAQHKKRQVLQTPDCADRDDCEIPAVDDGPAVVAFEISEQEPEEKDEHENEHTADHSSIGGQMHGIRSYHSIPM